jgi:two-component system CheB/CheR fusion protein
MNQMKLLVNISISFSQKDIQNGIPQTEINIIREGRATDNRWHICKDQSFLCLWFGIAYWNGRGDVGALKILRDLTEQKRGCNQKM